MSPTSIADLLRLASVEVNGESTRAPISICRTLLALAGAAPITHAVTAHTNDREAESWEVAALTADRLIWARASDAATDWPNMRPEPPSVERESWSIARTAIEYVSVIGTEQTFPPEGGSSAWWFRYALNGSALPAVVHLPGPGMSPRLHADVVEPFVRELLA